MATNRWVIHTASGEFKYGGFYEPTGPDQAYSVVEIPDESMPDLRTERYDATSATKRRPATAQEIADYDAAQLDATAKQAAVPRAVKAMLLFYLRDKLGRNPTAAERAAARDAFVQAYKDVT